MKTLLLLLLSLHLFANELEWVDEQIEAIKPPRDGISTSKVNSIKDPFIFLKKKKLEKSVQNKKKTTTTTTTKSKTQKIASAVSTNKIAKQVTSYSLDAIMNKSALINGKWYSLHSRVGKYTLSDIDTTSVILSYKTKKLLLSTRSKSRKLKFKNN